MSPAFCFSATLSCDRLDRYYPLGQVVNIEGANRLAGWQKGQVSDPEWQAMAASYQTA